MKKYRFRKIGKAEEYDLYMCFEDEIFQPGFIDNSNIYVLASEAAELERVLVNALKDIARQKLESEISEEDAEHADFNEGYDSIVRIARAALAAKEG